MLHSALYNEINLRTGLPRPANVLKLLSDGADPNYRPVNARFSIIECATHRCSLDIIQVFVDNPTTNFDPRPGKLGKSPLMYLLKRRGDFDHALQLHYELCVKIYDRMRKPANENSPLLYTALQHHCVLFARILIKERHALHVNGYYHLCSSHRIFNDYGIVELLYENGYRKIQAGIVGLNNDCSPFNAYIHGTGKGVPDVVDKIKHLFKL